MPAARNAGSKTVAAQDLKEFTPRMSKALGKFGHLMARTAAYPLSAR